MSPGEILFYPAGDGDAPEPTVFMLILALELVAELIATDRRAGSSGWLSTLQDKGLPAAIVDALEALPQRTAAALDEYGRFNAALNWHTPGHLFCLGPRPEQIPDLGEAIRRLRRRLRALSAPLDALFDAALVDAEKMERAVIELQAGRAIVGPGGRVVARSAALHAA